MQKRVLVFKSSPRTKGNSNLLAEQAAQGAKNTGAQVESYYLPGMDIHPCDACDICQETGVCVLKDDMQLLYPGLRAADAIMLASPIYWFTISGQAKLFIDRWYALQSTQGNALRGKQFGFILTYGDTDPYTSGAINAIRTFEDMVRYLKAEIVGMLYATANEEGEVLGQPETLEKAYQLGVNLARAS